MGTATVKHEGKRVLACIDGKVIDLPWEAAVSLGRAFLSAAKQAEEVEKHGVIIADSAILMRAGMPFTLSNNPKIQNAAKTAAEHDRDLRRYMPSIKSSEVVGTPTVIRD